MNFVESHFSCQNYSAARQISVGFPNLTKIVETAVELLRFEYFQSGGFDLNVDLDLSTVNNVLLL